MTRLEAIRQWEAAATKGPWAWQAADGSMIWLHGPDDLPDVVLDCVRCKSCQREEVNEKFRCGWPTTADGDFIAHVREDIKPLLAVATAAAEIA